jgi:divalent metal cation (Fe/Co/Zn/Cd) transporter
MHDNFDRDVGASALLATLNIVVGIATESTSVVATGADSLVTFSRGVSY